MALHLFDEPSPKFRPGDYVKLDGEKHSMQVVECHAGASHFYIEGKRGCFCKCRWKDRKGKEFEKWFHSESLKRSF
ncbi:MAG: hypothetical protein JST36_04160 [Bacteroidetes bacterium]|nr:hypothetical protein [Bacteroidota bacterium]